MLLSHIDASVSRPLSLKSVNMSLGEDFKRMPYLILVTISKVDLGKLEKKK